MEEVTDLGFGKCRLHVQVPERGSIQDVRGLLGKNVVTSFVGLAQEYFRKLEKEQVGGANGEVSKSKTGRLRTRIKYVGGSVEAACALGVADGIVDLVGMLATKSLVFSPRKRVGKGERVPKYEVCDGLIVYIESGETMKAAGLKAIDTVVSSTAVLIKGKRVSNPQLADLIASRIKGVISAYRPFSFSSALFALDASLYMSHSGVVSLAAFFPPSYRLPNRSHQLPSPTPTTPTNLACHSDEPLLHSGAKIHPLPIQHPALPSPQSNLDNAR